MMIATKMTRTPPSIRRKSNTRGPSSSGRGRPGRQRLDEQAGPGGADHGDRAPGGDVDRGRRTELVGLALGLDEDAPEPAGRDADRDGRLSADQRAGDEHQVVDRDGDHPPRCLLPLARSGDPWREAYDDRTAGRSADQSLGPNRMESHDSSGVSRSTAAPRRTDADPGAPSTGAGTDGSSVNGISLALPNR